MDLILPLISISHNRVSHYVSCRRGSMLWRHWIYYHNTNTIGISKTVLSFQVELNSVVVWIDLFLPPISISHSLFPCYLEEPEMNNIKWYKVYSSMYLRNYNYGYVWLTILTWLVYRVSHFVSCWGGSILWRHGIYYHNTTTIGISITRVLPETFQLSGKI